MIYSLRCYFLFSYKLSKRRIIAIKMGTLHLTQQEIQINLKKKFSLGRTTLDSTRLYRVCQILIEIIFIRCLIDSVNHHTHCSHINMRTNIKKYSDVNKNNVTKSNAKTHCLTLSKTQLLISIVGFIKIRSRLELSAISINQTECQ